jgi:hypothetical protein
MTHDPQQLSMIAHQSFDLIYRSVCNAIEALDDYELSQLRYHLAAIRDISQDESQYFERRAAILASRSGSFVSNEAQ